VADVYDALTADRVYRDAWSAERALALLEEESGSAFDPQCVAALKDVVGGPLGWRLGLAEPAAPSAVKNGALKARPA
jgi:HD-GYP domain-containing protein (c-di-GMP phosphodiesterase class II)